MNAASRDTPMAESLADAFRSAMRHLAASVTIITAGRGAGRRGLTATAVCSLSMDPPSMLICVNRLGQAHETISATGCFCVNVLGAGEEALARTFAGHKGAMGADKFASGQWLEMETGAPALASALASIDCVLTETTRTATHSVFFGAVRGVRLDAGKRPLLHYNREFFTL